MIIYRRYVCTCKSILYVHLLTYSIKVLLHVICHQEVRTDKTVLATVCDISVY